MKKTVLITGGAKGIGASIVRMFAHEGYNAAINYNTSEGEANELLNELTGAGFGAELFKADLRSEAQISAMFTAVNERFGGVDVLVNNAGIAHTGLVQDMTAEQWDNIFAVNVRSMFLCTKYALTYMLMKKRGHIINISSIWGMCGASCEAAYSASKAAVIGYTKALAKELGSSGIRVNCVAPGVIDTDMNRYLSADSISAIKEETPLGVIGKCGDAAEAVLYLARSEFVTGQIISPNGGLVI